MVTSKCFFLVLFFSVALSFALLCSASDHPRRSEDPRRRYHECQRRCQWETRGEMEQDRCEERCERQFRQEQRERQEEEGRRYRHDSNPEDPQRRFEECQEWCQQQGQRQQPQCLQQCRREFEEQREQQEQRSHRRHDSNPEDPQRRFEECQQWCEQQGQRQQPQCLQQCRREFEEQREQQEERSHRRHDSNPEDPQRRFEECQEWCQQQGQRQQPQCLQQCRREFEEQREQQEERSHRRHDSNPEDPQRRFEECQQRCEQQGQRQQPQCQQQCQREFQQQREQAQRQLQQCQQQCQQEEQRPERKQQCVRQCREKFEQQPNSRDWEEEEEEDEREEWRQSPNPYYFPRRKFAQARFQEDNGNFWVLQKFSQKHHLLKGINEYRVALIEAHPNTFVLPHHCDAEKIYIVTNGKGTITFVTHKNKESFNVVPGVVVRIPAGSTVYLVNQDNKEKLTVAVLHRPVNNPGQFEEFFPAGQEQPQSYYRSFSREILEAVFNTRSEQLDKLFHGRQSQKGMFRRASQEQIKSLSQGATTPKGKEERFAFNLLAQKPKYSNQNGKFFEACPREFELLQNADAAVVGFEINQGSIFVPHYNSKSTFVVLITEGNGHVEMVCPHLSSQSSREEEEDERRSGEYRKVGTELSGGDVFVVPAGHPVTFVASQNHNLRALAFGLYHQNSTRIFVAGKNNMVRQMDSAAKEISFGVPSKLIDEVFNNNPQEAYFVSREGKKQRGSEESRDNPISSILDFARLF